jgi:hypothetical protein
MRKSICSIISLLLVLSAGAGWATIPKESPENSFEVRIVKAFSASADLLNKGLQDVRETLSTSGALISVEAKSEFTDGDELLDQVVAWAGMFTTTVPSDAVPFKKLKTLLWQKQAAVQNLSGLVGAATSDINGVIRLKKNIKSLDKKIVFQFKQLKGKMKLVPGKPLPAEAEK